jgi:hypothetical protein
MVDNQRAHFFFRASGPEAGAGVLCAAAVVAQLAGGDAGARVTSAVAIAGGCGVVVTLSFWGGTRACVLLADPATHTVRALPVECSEKCVRALGVVCSGNDDTFVFAVDERSVSLFSCR